VQGRLQRAAQTGHTGRGCRLPAPLKLLLGLPLHWAARQLHRSGPHAAAAAPRLVRWQRAQALRRARRLVPRPAQAHVRWRCSPHCRRPRPCRSDCAAAARAPAAPARPLARPPRVLLAHARARAQLARQVVLRAARRWWGRGPRQKRRGQGSSLAPDQPGTAARRRPHHQPRLRPALRDALCACVCRRAPRQWHLQLGLLTKKNTPASGHISEAPRLLLLACLGCGCAAPAALGGELAALTGCDIARQVALNLPLQRLFVLGRWQQGLLPHGRVRRRANGSSGGLASRLNPPYPRVRRFKLDCRAHGRPLTFGLQTRLAPYQRAVMAGRGSYGTLPSHGDFDADDGVPAPPPPVSTIARRRPTPDDNAAAPDGHHFISTAQSTEGLGIQSPTSGAFGAALHSQREGGKPGNMADTLQGAGPACSIDRAIQSLCSMRAPEPSLQLGRPDDSHC